MAIRERLSSQSFYYLTDLVFAATRAVQLLEKERKGLWKTHRQQGIITKSSTGGLVKTWYLLLRKMLGLTTEHYPEPHRKGHTHNIHKNKEVIIL